MLSQDESHNYMVIRWSPSPAFDPNLISRKQLNVEVGEIDKVVVSTPRAMPNEVHEKTEYLDYVKIIAVMASALAILVSLAIVIWYCCSRAFGVA